MSSEPALAVPARRRASRVFYGWWIVIAGMLANYAYSIQFNSSFGVFIRPMVDDLGWSRSVLAGAQTFGSIPQAITVALLGPWVDRHGARWLVGIGGILVGASFIALATMADVWQLYLYRGVVTSVGAVCLGAFIGVTISNWFLIRRGRALSFVAMGQSLATASLPLLASFVIASWGWRQAWFAMGIMAFVLAAPAVVVFRRRPEDVGLQPDGVDSSDSERGALSARDRRRREELLAADVTWTRRQVVRTSTFWIMTFAYGLSSFSVTGTNLHLVPYLEDAGYPAIVAAGAISLRAVTALVANPIWGWSVDRLPLKISVVAPFLLMMASMLALLLQHSTAGIVAGLVLYGFGNSGAGILRETIWAHYFGRVSLGSVRSIVEPLQTALGAAGPLAMALFFDATGSYQGAWLGLAVGFGLCAVLMRSAREPEYPGPQLAPREP